jgi:hypothetical protein
MPAHESIMMDRAHNPAFASIMSATMIVDLNARSETKSANETLAIQQDIEIDPESAVCRPGTAC